jgi:hypothetical protein
VRNAQSALRHQQTQGSTRHETTQGVIGNGFRHKGDVQFPGTSDDFVLNNCSDDRNRHRWISSAQFGCELQAFFPGML